MNLKNVIPAAATPEQIQQRLATCRACDAIGVIPVVKTEVCKACGCPLANKTKLLNSKCPQGKW